MFRQIITTTNSELILHLPPELVGHKIEVIAFDIDESNDAPAPTPTGNKYTIENYNVFCKKHSVDFSKIGKWTREDMYNDKRNGVEE